MTIKNMAKTSGESNMAYDRLTPKIISNGTSTHNSKIELMRLDSTELRGNISLGM